MFKAGVHLVRKVLNVPRISLVYELRHVPSVDYEKDERLKALLARGRQLLEEQEQSGEEDVNGDEQGSVTGRQ